MSNLNDPRTRRRLGLVSVVTSLLMAASLAFVSQGASQAAGTTTAKSTNLTTVAHSPKGHLASKIVGTTKSGNRVTGDFVPLHVSRHNGHVRVKGVVEGVVHRADGTTKTFTVVRKMRVKTVDGVKAAHGRPVNGKATCDILHLVLAPLDLDLLGLQVHLDKVLLDIVAKSGSGNLLGNLLCAVTHLLDDGSLAGDLGKLVDLLNQILGKLGLGL